MIPPENHNFGLIFLTMKSGYRLQLASIRFINFISFQKASDIVNDLSIYTEKQNTLHFISKVNK